MKDLYLPDFSHIYIENGIKDHPRTKKILSYFKTSVRVPVNHYKDIFNRTCQSYSQQMKSRCLILAEKKDGFLYEGAPVCQNFGNRSFYYSSNVMNCVYDCEYCFLKGMYPSSYIVIFVNLEDTLDAVRKELKKCDDVLYISISYESDLLAIEKMTGMLKEWRELCLSEPDLMLEVRTKCASTGCFDDIAGLGEKSDCDRMILAYTMTPDYVIETHESKTPSLDMRIKAAKKAQERGIPVRLCFDPMLYFSGFREAYEDMVKRVFSEINPDKINDVSLGSFRISKDYLKNFRKEYDQSVVAWFPYELKDGYYQYPEELRIEMEDYLKEQLLRYIPEEKIFSWK